jgi:hypothetical protein
VTGFGTARRGDRNGQTQEDQEIETVRESSGHVAQEERQGRDELELQQAGVGHQEVNNVREELAMAKSKKNNQSKPSVKVQDITPKKNVQGGKVHLEYKPQKADGTLDSGVAFKYDIKGQKG